MGGGVRLLIGASSIAWLALVDCGGTPPPPTGTGGTVASGGTQGTGGRATGGSTSICPNDDCCDEGHATSTCEGSTFCWHYLPGGSNIDCGTPEQCQICVLGCDSGHCRSPSNPTGGTGNGGNGGLGGEGGLGGDGNP
jgi:hypothetical protein